MNKYQAHELARGLAFNWLAAIALVLILYGMCALCCGCANPYRTPRRTDPVIPSDAVPYIIVDGQVRDYQGNVIALPDLEMYYVISPGALRMLYRRARATMPPSIE